MRTLLIKRNKWDEETNTITSTGIDSDTLEELHSDVAAWLPSAATPKPVMSRLRGNIGGWLFAFSAATSPIAYLPPRDELRRSGASSILWSMQEKRGTPISLAQARMLALKILTDTEQRLKQEREVEARIFMSIWEDED